MSNTISLSTLANVTGGRLQTPADRRVEAWNKAHQSGSQQLHDDFFRRDFSGDWFRR